MSQAPNGTEALTLLSDPVIAQDLIQIESSALIEDWQEDKELAPYCA